SRARLALCRGRERRPDRLRHQPTGCDAPRARPSRQQLALGSGRSRHPSAVLSADGGSERHARLACDAAHRRMSILIGMCSAYLLSGGHFMMKATLFSGVVAVIALLGGQASADSALTEADQKFVTGASAHQLGDIKLGELAVR